MRQRTEIKGRDLRPRSGAWVSACGSWRSRKNLGTLHPLVFVCRPWSLFPRRRVELPPSGPLTTHPPHAQAYCHLAACTRKRLAILVVGFGLPCPWSPQSPRCDVVWSRYAVGSSSTHREAVVDCLAPASGVAGAGSHIGKGKKKAIATKNDAFGGGLDGCCFHLILALHT